MTWVSSGSNQRTAPIERGQLSSPSSVSQVTRRTSKHLRRVLSNPPPRLKVLSHQPVSRFLVITWQKGHAVRGLRDKVRVETELPAKASPLHAQVLAEATSVTPDIITTSMRKV